MFVIIVIRLHDMQTLCQDGMMSKEMAHRQIRQTNNYRTHKPENTNTLLFF